jgi:magnesium transporter
MSTALNIFVYTRGIRQDAVPVEDIQSVLANPDTFVWLGLHEPDERMLQSLKKELALH